MFTGIIEALGTVQQITRQGGDLQLSIASDTLDFSDVRLGDSVATQGVCLTVIALQGRQFVADVSRETLQHTTLPEWTVGQRVNLEKALLPTTRLGGHLVSGHVDAVGVIRDVRRDARSLWVQIESPVTLARYLARKGSVCVDGVSLTINAVEDLLFELNIVPHTADMTTLSSLRQGSRVNLEVDVLARYLERMLNSAASEPESAAGVSMSALLQHGFMRRR